MAWMKLVRATHLPRAAFICAVLVMLAMSSSRAGTTGTLDTPSFKIKIDIRCEEGEVTCDDVGYVGKNKKTGETLELTGKTAHHMDGEGTPTRFLGYIFKNNDVTYFLSEEGELRVTRGEKILLKEKGTWTWNDLAETNNHRSDRKK